MTSPEGSPEFLMSFQGIALLGGNMNKLANQNGLMGTTANKDIFWEQALKLSEQRLAVLASNIANADTPNFKARDIDFGAALKQALKAERSEGARNQSKPGGTRELAFAAPLLYRMPEQHSVDGNTVEIDKELSTFSEQAIKHEFILQGALDEYKEMSSLFKNLAE